MIRVFFRDLADEFLETNLISRSSITGDQDLEIPGAYQGSGDCKNEPSVNLHAKMIKFGSHLRAVKLADGELCRRLSILGSDGELYYYSVVQTSDQAISSMVTKLRISIVYYVAYFYIHVYVDSFF